MTSWLQPQTRGSKNMFELLERAQQEKVKVSAAKKQYKAREVKYIRNIVSESGMKRDVEKEHAISRLPSPSKEELQRFLRMVYYFSQFIPNHSAITAPLRNLLKKDVVWIWSHHEHTQAVKRLKEILSRQPVLKVRSGLGVCILSSRCSPNSLCLSIPHSGRAVLRSNRKRIACSCIWLREIQPVCMCMADQWRWSPTTVKPFLPITKKPLTKAFRGYNS